MNIKETLSLDIKEAMKTKNQFVLSVLRMLAADIKNKEIADKNKEGLADEEIVKIINSGIKKRKESIVMYEQAGREELADKEKKEIKILERYLPEQLTKEEVEAIIDEEIKKQNATSLKDMGKVMGKVMPRLQGRADGGLVNGLVKDKLQS